MIGVKNPGFLLVLVLPLTPISVQIARADVNVILGPAAPVKNYSPIAFNPEYSLVFHDINFDPPLVPIYINGNSIKPINPNGGTPVSSAPEPNSFRCGVAALLALGIWQTMRRLKSKPLAARS